MVDRFASKRYHIRAVFRLLVYRQRLSREWHHYRQSGLVDARVCVITDSLSGHDESFAETTEIM